MSETRGFRIKIEPGDVLVEVMSVTLAILLALGIGKWQDDNARRALLHDSIANIVAEMDGNAARIDRVHARHVRLLDTFVKLNERANNHLTLMQLSDAVKHGAPDGLGLAIPQSTAWQIAQNSRGIELLPYAQRAAITSLYDLQQFYSTAEQKFVDGLYPESLSPDGNFALVADNAESRLGDMVQFENELTRAYAGVKKDLKSYCLTKC